MTTLLSVPGKSLSLLGSPGLGTDNDASTTGGAVPQAMQLDLEEGVLQNILRSARSGGKGVHVSFGKTIVSPFTVFVLFYPRLNLTIDTQFWESIEAIDRYTTIASNRALQL